MEVEFVDGCLDPLHMPCVLKTEVVEAAGATFNYQYEQTSIDLNSEVDDVLSQLTDDNELQRDMGDVAMQSDADSMDQNDVGSQETESDSEMCAISNVVSPLSPTSNKTNYKKIACKICNKQILSRNLKQHITKIHKNQTCKSKSKQALYFHCIICKNTFDCKTKLKNHVLKIHKNLKISNSQFEQLFFNNSRVKIVKIFSRKPIKIENCKYKAIEQNINKFQCEICDKSFKYYKNLKKHIKKHVNCRLKSKNVIKNKIDANVKSNKVRKVEKKQIKNNFRTKVKFNCEICDKAFVKQKLQIHMASVHSTKRVHCKICNKSFKCLEYLRNHNRKPCQKLNQIDSKFYCDLCQKLFGNFENLKMHIRNHMKLANNEEIKYYKCKACKFKSELKISLYRHIKALHIKSKSYSQKYLTKIKQKLNATNVKIKCEICDKAFVKQKLQIHMASVHSTKRVHCKICNKSYKSVEYLRNHNKKPCQKLNNVDSKFYCDLCPKLFTNFVHLKIHIRNHVKLANNEQVKSYNCKACKFKSELKISLYRHIKTLHTKSKCYSEKYLTKIKQKLNAINVKFKCEICDKAFVKQKLQIHMASVHSTKRVHCKFCNRSYKSEESLKRHNKKPCQKLNNIDSKFYCDLCQKFFANFLHLKLHIKNHMKLANNKTVKYYNCKACKFKYELKISLYRHIKEMHPKSKYCSEKYLNKLKENLNAINVKFKCEICSKPFNREKLKIHMVSVHGTERVNCKICNKTFKSVEYLRNHNKKPCQKNKFKCQFCTKIFNYEKNLKIHLKNHKKLENNLEIISYNCYNCAFKSEFKFQLIRHIQRKHSNEATNTKIKCKICKKFVFKGYLSKHMENVHSENKKQYFCDLCNFKNTSKFCLEKHLKNFHKFNEVIFRCKNCTEIFTSNRDLRKHELIHLSKDGKYYSCVKCKRRLISTEEVNAHMKNIHLIKLKLTCINCDEKFVDKSEMLKHLWSKHTKFFDESKNCYKCIECGKIFKNAQCLSNHKVHVHDNQPSQCQTCGKICKNISAFKRHVKFAHGNVKEFACQFCDKKFSLMAYKINHEILQHNYKSNVLKPEYKELCTLKKIVKKSKIKEELKAELTCQFCGKIATSKCNLRAHIYVVHSNIRPFKCDKCEQSFKYKRDLKNHSFRHSEKKPFYCPTCNKGMVTLQELRIHVLQVHVKL